jgi:hypothetical protein
VERKFEDKALFQDMNIASDETKTVASSHLNALTLLFTLIGVIGSTTDHSCDLRAAWAFWVWAQARPFNP